MYSALGSGAPSELWELVPFFRLTLELNLCVLVTFLLKKVPKESRIAPCERLEMFSSVAGWAVPQGFIWLSLSSHALG